MSHIVDEEIRTVKRAQEELVDGMRNEIGDIRGTVEGLKNVTFLFPANVTTDRAAIVENLKKNILAVNTIRNQSIILPSNQIPSVVKNFSETISAYKSIQPHAVAIHPVIGNYTNTQVGRLEGIMQYMESVAKNASANATEGLMQSLDLFSGGQPSEGAAKIQSLDAEDVAAATETVTAANSLLAHLSSLREAHTRAQSNSAQTVMNKLAASDALVHAAVSNAMKQVGNASMGVGDPSLTFGQVLQQISSEFAAQSTAAQVEISSMVNLNDDLDTSFMTLENDRTIPHLAQAAASRAAQILDHAATFHSDLDTQRSTVDTDERRISEALQIPDGVDITAVISDEAKRESGNDQVDGFDELTKTVAAMIDSAIVT
jgi:hypothetical protein